MPLLMPRRLRRRLLSSDCRLRQERRAAAATPLEIAYAAPAHAAADADVAPAMMPPPLLPATPPLSRRLSVARVAFDVYATLSHHATYVAATRYFLPH